MHVGESSTHVMVLVEDEPDAGHHDSLEPSLEDRRHRAPPGRVDEDERLGTLDDVGVSLDHRIQQRSIAVVREPLGGAHRRPELLGVEIERRDVVAARARARPGAALQSRG